jgi:predicted KAP-like P-loop ATPase
MWSDNETTLDLLGFKVHADLVRAVVTDPKLLPITIGIFGDWGSGKTSVMKMLQRDLNSENFPEGSPERSQLEGVACLYFNGWLFEGYDDAKSALLSSVLTELKEHKKFGPKIKDQATSLLRSVEWMRLVRFGFKEIALPAALAFITGGATILPTLIASGKNIFDKIQSSVTDPKAEGTIDWSEFVKTDGNTDVPMDVRTFRSRFAEMLNNSDIKTLVILIDDLDRCTPQRIIDNLEAIKLFLSVEHTAFVIGADPRIVRYAISSIYRLGEIQKDELADPSSNIVKEYVEKLIQVPYHLPRLSPAEVETYMSLLFCFQGLDEVGFNTIHKALIQHRDKDRYTVFSLGAIQNALGGSLPAELQNNLLFCNAAASLITEGLKGNPRQVKRFLNAFILRKKLAQVARLSHIKDPVLVKLMILEYTEEDSFNELYKWQAADDGFPKQLQQLESAICSPSDSTEDVIKGIGTKWGLPFQKKWITMDPSLSNEDLRDYFWIARDRLQSSLSDVSLVPPLVRHIFDNLLSSNQGLQVPAAQSAKELHSDEAEMLFGLLFQQVSRQPTVLVGYSAFRLLIESDVSGSAKSFASLLLLLPPEIIPPAVGMQLNTMLKSKPELQREFDPVIEKLENTQTRVGRAVSRRKER